MRLIRTNYTEIITPWEMIFRGVTLLKAFLKIIFVRIHVYKVLMSQNHFELQLHLGTSHHSKSVTMDPPKAFLKDRFRTSKIISLVDFHHLIIISFTLCDWRPCTSTRVSKSLMILSTNSSPAVHLDWSANVGDCFDMSWFYRGSLLHHHQHSFDIHGHPSQQEELDIISKDLPPP